MATDVRWKDVVTTTVSPETRVVLIGFPVDEGVRRNGGRIGASQAPARIRKQLSLFTPDSRNGNKQEHIFRLTADLGDLSPSGSLEDMLDQLGDVVASHLLAGRIPIILGGGHETAFGHFLGYQKAGIPVAVRNVDAHADVRELKNGQRHSGSPFRDMITVPNSVIQDYFVAGLEPQSVASDHAAFVKEHGGLYWRQKISYMESKERLAFWYRFYQSEHAVLSSFDIDAVSGAFAPGVSAINPAGFTPEVWLEGAWFAGSSTNVRSMDLVEMNPLYDRDSITAKLAALTVWTFLNGLAFRKTGV